MKTAEKQIDYMKEYLKYFTPCSKQYKTGEEQARQFVIYGAPKHDTYVQSNKIETNPESLRINRENTIIKY